MRSGKPQDDEGLLTASGEARAATLFRLVASFMAVVMLTFVLVEGWRIWRDYRHAFVNAENSVSNLARATAQHAEDAIRQVDAITAALAERVEGDGILNLDRKRLHRLLHQQAQIMPQLHGLFIYDAQGYWLVTDKTSVPANANNADRDYFEYHRTHPSRDVHIGPVIKSRSTSELIIPISRRLDAPDGSFAGVLLGTIKVDWFLQYYGDFKIDQRGALVLAMRDGTILVRRPFSDKIIGTSLAKSDIFLKHLPQADQGVAEATAVVDGTQRIYGFQALPTYPLVAEAGLSRESIVEPWRHDMIKSVLILVLLLIGLSAFGWIVLRQLRERIAIERALLQAHQTLKSLALTDALTGLGNRRRLDGVLDSELGRARRQDYSLAVVMLDLDYFKRYNDHYGHPAGDRCLQRIGEVLQAALKRPGDLAVRYGGEEFTLLLPDTDVDGATTLVQEILDNLRRLGIEHLTSPLGIVSISAGIAVGYPARQALTAATLMAAADGALYVAKEQGRDRLHVTCDVADGVG